ncbi:MAG: alpha/beta fold hydrolase, partial [Alphaproteobacteria bacterium]|nr:alpha/beta fold hydrolase [Alphaproteobacteria bacterium]
GEVLPEVRLHYTTLGEPHRNAQGAVDNAVLLLHWTAANGQALLSPDYREALFAAGAPFDASRYFVILPDAIGHGRSSKPSDGLKARFPHYGYGDMVDLQHRLVVDVLGVQHLHAVVGMSMGCMNAWEWAERFPDAMDGIMPVACFPSAVTGRNLLWRRMAVDTIKSDPEWAGGNYDKPIRSVVPALEILRLMIDGVPHFQAVAGSRDGADAFIREFKQQVAGADANDMVYTLESSGDFDGSGLEKVKARVFALNFADDEFYRDSLQTLQRDMQKVRTGHLVVRPVSQGSIGHLSMTRPSLWADQARAFASEIARP